MSRVRADVPGEGVLCSARSTLVTRPTPHTSRSPGHTGKVSGDDWLLFQKGEWATGPVGDTGFV